MDVKEIYENLLPIARTIAQNKHGALFIIGPRRKLKKNHDLMFPSLVEGFSLKEPGMEKVLLKLATLDGAVMISDSGELLAYGAKLKRSKPLRGFGTRHAAAHGMTQHIKDAIAILISEESNWVKIFREGEIVLEMKGEEFPKNVDQKIFSYLINKDTSLLTDENVSVTNFPKIQRKHS